jgi:hypothetical protein
MSLQIITPEPLDTSLALAEKILKQLFAEDEPSLSADQLLEQVPELKNIDALTLAVEMACNDFLLVEQKQVIWTESNSQATVDSLERAFRGVTGKSTRVFDSIMDSDEFDDRDPEEGSEPEDDDTEEGDTHPPEV